MTDTPLAPVFSQGRYVSAILHRGCKGYEAVAESGESHGCFPSQKEAAVETNGPLEMRGRAIVHLGRVDQGGIMTLAVAIKATDAIVLAADSRGTIGDPRGLTAVNDTQKKIFEFGKCGLGISGASELALSMMDEFGKRGINKPNDVDEAAVALTQAAGIYDGWFHGINVEQRPGILFLLGGYRTSENGAAPVPMVYLMASNTRFAPQLAGPYPMMAGVPQYAVYLSHRYYDPLMTGDRDLLPLSALDFG